MISASVPKPMYMSVPPLRRSFVCPSLPTDAVSANVEGGFAMRTAGNPFFEKRCGKHCEHRDDE